MSDLQSAAVPLAAMLAAFIIIGFSLFLARHAARWVEKKKQITKADSDAAESNIEKTESTNDDPNNKTDS